MGKEESTVLEVQISKSELVCGECGEMIHADGYCYYNEKHQAICLDCAELAHLVFLPSGNKALTTRAKDNSTLSAIVFKRSSARKRNECQGILVEREALSKAEDECLSDEDKRAANRKYAEERRIISDENHVHDFAMEIRRIYPNIPVGSEFEIANHACEKYSGRVGRTAEAKALSQNMIELSVRAFIRHKETNYDLLLMQGEDRQIARKKTQGLALQVEARWR